MSMLTPPGMGGKYRITGDRYPRMRRPRNRRRIVLAVVGAVTALGLVGWGTLQLIDVFTGQGGKARAASRKADCKPQHVPAQPAVALPKPGDITVNVFNATPRSGLAKKTADELKKRGFKIGEVDNASATYDKKVKGPGILLGSAKGDDGRFKVLGAHLAGASTESDQRKGDDVDLIIGDGFKKLVLQKDAERTLEELAHPAAPPMRSQC